MPDSKRQQIVTALDARLKLITVANGYETNLGTNVKWYRQEPFAEAEIGISCEDSETAPEWIGFGVQLHRMTVVIDAVLPATAQAPELRAAAADIVKAIGADVTLGGLAEDCILGDVQMDVGQESVRAGGARLSAVFEYATDPWTAY